MAFASFDGRRGAQPTAEINMVPLIDVMLVLLVIFIVTAPLLTHAVKLDLPRASSATHEPPPQRIELAIEATGQRFWNGEPMTRDDVAARLRAEGQRETKPEVQLRADHRVPYGDVAQTLADAASAGLTRISFVSVPEGR
jgi:biopolymer transport protein ExbD